MKRSLLTSFLRPLLAHGCWALALLACTGTLALAQSTDDGSASTAWQNDSAPPPPAYDVHRLIEIDMPSYTSVKLGFDPATIRIDAKDGIVRYVVVARGPSALNASYEGIHCATGEYRVYARRIQDGPWIASPNSDWKPMRGHGGILVTYPYQLARNGFCLGPTVRTSVQDMVRNIETGDSALYR